MSAFSVSIDREKCEGCEECMNNFPVGVSQITDGRADPFRLIHVKAVRHV